MSGVVGFSISGSNETVNDVRELRTTTRAEVGRDFDAKPPLCAPLVRMLCASWLMAQPDNVAGIFAALGHVVEIVGQEMTAAGETSFIETLCLQSPRPSPLSLAR